jgi:beta-mannosidase
MVVSAASFTYRADWKDKRLFLRFGATDYYADAWINGELLGRHEGYIDPYEYDYQRSSSTGRANELLVRILGAVNYYWKHRSYTVKGAYGAVDQKPDDITPLGYHTTGDDLRGAGVRIQDLAVDTRLTTDGDAEVEGRSGIGQGSRASGAGRAEFIPTNFSAPERHEASTTLAGRTVKVLIPVKDPRLWWTWDHGKPNLYTLEVRLRDHAGHLIDSRSIAVGIREIERIGWEFYLNRRRMFIRGYQLLLPPVPVRNESGCLRT